MLSIFNFKRNKCLNCEKKLPRSWVGLFCEACEPKETVQKQTTNRSPVQTPVAEEYLPDDLLEDTIATMGEGETAYTLPWAMFANPSRRLFIVGTYPIFKKPEGTIQLRITKKNGEILVDKSSIGDRLYSPGEPCYVGVSECDYIPIKLVRHL